MATSLTHKTTPDGGASDLRHGPDEIHRDVVFTQRSILIQSYLLGDVSLLYRSRRGDQGEGTSRGRHMGRLDRTASRSGHLPAFGATVSPHGGRIVPMDSPNHLCRDRGSLHDTRGSRVQGWSPLPPGLRTAPPRRDNCRGSCHGRRSGFGSNQRGQAMGDPLRIHGLHGKETYGHEFPDAAEEAEAWEAGQQGLIRYDPRAPGKSLWIGTVEGSRSSVSPSPGHLPAGPSSSGSG